MPTREEGPVRVVRAEEPAVPTIDVERVVERHQVRSVLTAGWTNDDGTVVALGIPCKGASDVWYDPV